MTRLLIATGNRGKIVELQAMIGSAAEVVSLYDLGLTGAEETGDTFEENATLKARESAARSGLITLADDSGIAVDALGGAPGVRSARYAGEDADDERNRQKLQRKMHGIPGPERAARFVCVIAVTDPAGTTRTFDATLEGAVALEARGTGGFGYDSLLQLPDGRTVAELSAEEKNTISHRGIALRNALPYLHELLASKSTSHEG